MPRDKRPALRGADPIHITVRLLDGLPSLRQSAEGRALLKAFQGGKNRFGFRLVHFSILRTHLHLIVEAEDRRSLSRGMTGLQVRITRALNKLWSHSGQVFLEGYHEHILKTPTEVRNALAYVLHNAKEHEGALVKDLDEFTSSTCLRWLEGNGEDRLSRNPRRHRPRSHMAPHRRMEKTRSFEHA